MVYIYGSGQPYTCVTCYIIVMVVLCVTFYIIIMVRACYMCHVLHYWTARVSKYTCSEFLAPLRIQCAKHQPANYSCILHRFHEWLANQEFFSFLLAFKVVSCLRLLAPGCIGGMSHAKDIYRVGQNRICTYIYTVYLVISKPKIPYVHRIYMVLANSRHIRMTLVFH
jgi:hypothetical protein